MCFNELDNAMVIIEIKSPSVWAKHEALGQILCYIFREMNYINDKFPKIILRRYNVKNEPIANSNDFKIFPEA